MCVNKLNHKSKPHRSNKPFGFKTIAMQLLKNLFDLDP